MADDSLTNALSSGDSSALVNALVNAGSQTDPLTPGPGPQSPQAPDPATVGQAIGSNQAPPNLGQPSTAPTLGPQRGSMLPGIGGLLANIIKPPMVASGPGQIARPASRAGEFESFLGQFLYSMGQGFAQEGRGPGAFGRGFGAAATAPIGLGMQQAQFQQQQQENQARIQQQQAQTAQTQEQTKQLGQMVYVPGLGMVPFQIAKAIGGQAMGAQAKVESAQIANRFKAGPAGLYDTQTRQLIPSTSNGIAITPEIAQDYNLPQQYVGKQMKLSDFQSMERTQLSMAPTTTTTTDPLGLTTTSTKSKNLPQSLIPQGGAGTPSSAVPPIPKPSGGGGSAITSMAQRMVDGDMDPSQVPKKSVAFVSQQADQYSMQKYGQHFDMATAANDYQYARNATTQNTLKMINGITEKGGAIDIAQKAAQNLPQFDVTTANKIFNSAATIFGSNEATNFHTAMLGLADEYSKVMGGGVSSDTGREQALSLLRASYSKGQLSGAVDIMRQDIAARKQALIGGNRYLQRQYGGVAAVPPDQRKGHPVFDPMNIR